MANIIASPLLRSALPHLLIIRFVYRVPPKSEYGSLSYSMHAPAPSTVALFAARVPDRTGILSFNKTGFPVVAALNHIIQQTSNIAPCSPLHFCPEKDLIGVLQG